MVRKILDIEVRVAAYTPEEEDGKVEYRTISGQVAIAVPGKNAGEIVDTTLTEFAQDAARNGKELLGIELAEPEKDKKQ